VIIIPPSTEILRATPDLEQLIEEAGRVCWKSEEKITETSHVAFINMLKDKHHESVLEHGAITVRFIVNRGVSHELVRHRLMSPSQESTRYCNYSKEKFGEEITVIKPLFYEEGSVAYAIWLHSIAVAEESYFELLRLGSTPQEARDVLQNNLKTEVVVTANPREWRHIFKQRTAPAAHPQMREVMIPLLDEFITRWPVLFSDLK